MSWLYVKRKDKPQMYYITEEAYQQTFKEQGFEIVSNATNNVGKTQKQVNRKNVQPTSEELHKRQCSKRSEV